MCCLCDSGFIFVLGFSLVIVCTDVESMIAYVCNDIVPLLMCIAIQFKLAVKNLWSLLHIMSGKANRRGSSFEPSWPNSITVGRIASCRDRIGSTGKDGANGGDIQKEAGVCEGLKPCKTSTSKKKEFHWKKY